MLVNAARPAGIASSAGSLSVTVTAVAGSAPTLFSVTVNWTG